MQSIGKGILTQTGWEIIKKSYEAKQAINDGSSFMTGNGYLGYRGTFAHDTSEAYVGCFVTDTWDNADGKWEELSNVPNALFTTFHVQGHDLTLTQPHQDFERSLDLSQGLTGYQATFPVSAGTVTLKEEKFASLAQHHVLGMRHVITADHPTVLVIESGIDTVLWDLNQQHLRGFDVKDTARGFEVQAQTSQSNIQVNVLERRYPLEGGQVVVKEGKHLMRWEVTLKENEPLILDKLMVVTSSNDHEHPSSALSQMEASVESYDALKQENKLAWDAYWARFDIIIEGNLSDQVATRFNTYHAIIATPMHKPLPIGARGLSCQAYQGAAFWDQEIYNTPMYLFSYPKQARMLLEYRYQTLDGARKKARKHGYEGAFYAWISGKTGEEICPDFFFKDVLSDRPIRNHFNLWQIHISPDIAYSIVRYYEVTQDEDFMRLYGLEMMFEIARFIASRVVFKPRLNRYELAQVQGPDEYHENVDNNAFTNYQSHAALKETLRYLEHFNPEDINKVRQQINLGDHEISLWHDITNKLYLPKPNQEGLIEQFDGFFNLESIVPAHEVTKRLKHPEEYYGWPNGITVFTQCNKQADMVQLFSLHPSLFNRDTMRMNYAYYEPRTLHFSSLSPSTHALVAARLGMVEEAYRHFKKALMIDLLNTNEAVSGGTFIGGMHTANNGATWAMITQGFLGLKRSHNHLYALNPVLPKEWKSVTFFTDIQGVRHKIYVSHEEISILNLSQSPMETTILLKEETITFRSQYQSQKQSRA